MIGLVSLLLDWEETQKAMPVTANMNTESYVEDDYAEREREDFY